MATPFVQGRLRQEPLTVRIETSCAHCGQELVLNLNQDLDLTVETPGARPLAFVPEVDLHALEDPSIIDGF